MGKHILFTEQGEKLYTTTQAATMLGMARGTLSVWLSRHRDAKPERKVNQDLFWTEEEIVHIRTTRER